MDEPEIIPEPKPVSRKVRLWDLLDEIIREWGYGLDVGCHNKEKHPTFAKLLALKAEK